MYKQKLITNILKVSSTRLSKFSLPWLLALLVEQSTNDPKFAGSNPACKNV